MADGTGSDSETATQFVQARLREGLRDADAILRSSLTTPNTTIAEVLYQRASATKEYAAVARAMETDLELSSLVCHTAELSVFAGIALAYRFFIEGRRR
jgi:hypothetical protein